MESIVSVVDRLYALEDLWKQTANADYLDRLRPGGIGPAVEWLWQWSYNLTVAGATPSHSTVG